MAAQLIARKGLVRPAAVVIDRAGDKFLAGATLAQDKNINVLRCQAADLLADRLHGRVIAHQPVRGGFLAICPRPSPAHEAGG